MKESGYTGGWGVCRRTTQEHTSNQFQVPTFQNISVATVLCKLGHKDTLEKVAWLCHQ